MDHDFYDVKTKSHVKSKVLEAVTYEKGSRVSYAFKGKTSDGRPLTAFVSKAIFDKFKK